eukprot:8529650-Pyramimonas_sp.AAC.1
MGAGPSAARTPNRRRKRRAQREERLASVEQSRRISSDSTSSGSSDSYFRDSDDDLDDYITRLEASVIQRTSSTDHNSPIRFQRLQRAITASENAARLQDDIIASDNAALEAAISASLDTRAQESSAHNDNVVSLQCINYLRAQSDTATYFETVCVDSSTVEEKLTASSVTIAFIDCGVGSSYLSARQLRLTP